MKISSLQPSKNVFVQNQNISRSKHKNYSPTISFRGEEGIKMGAAFGGMLGVSTNTAIMAIAATSSPISLPLALFGLITITAASATAGAVIGDLMQDTFQKK